MYFLFICNNHLLCISGGFADVGARDRNKDTNFKYDKVRKNANGGVLVTADEIQAAFNLLDSDKNGVSLPVLKKRLGIMFPGFSGTK